MTITAADAMSRKIVLFGAGATGRGHVGLLCWQGGFELVLVDKKLELVELLRRAGRYTVRLWRNRAPQTWLFGRVHLNAQIVCLNVILPMDEWSRGVDMRYNVYYMNANELDNQFIEALKVIFKDKSIEVVVSEVDETAYLFQSEANRRRLLQAVRNIENQQNLVEVSLDTLQ